MRQVVHHVNGVRQVEARSKGREARLQFKENDPVFLKRYTKEGKWANPYYDETYRIRKVLGNDEYELRDLHNERMRGNINVNFLKPAPKVSNDGEIQPDADEYYVEKIVGRRHTLLGDGERGFQYKVRFRST